MLGEIIEHGIAVEDQLKEATKQNVLLQQGITHNEETNKEIGRENSETMKLYDTLQKDLGAIENKLAESQHMTLNF